MLFDRPFVWFAPSAHSFDRQARLCYVCLKVRSLCFRCFFTSVDAINNAMTIYHQKPHKYAYEAYYPNTIFQ